MIRIASAGLTLGLLACTGREQAPVDTSTVTHISVSSAPMTVTARGIGPLQVGVNLREARAALPDLALPPGSDASGCDYARSPALPPGVLVMVENGMAVRVDVDTGATPTAEGVRIGDAVSRVRSVYRSRVSTSPNKYTDEPELRVRSSLPDDTLHEMIFETVAGKVVHYHAGQRPQVRYVEGCS